jgi:hypothetical protein
MWPLNLRNVTPYSPVEFNRGFEGNYCIYFQCQGIRYASKQEKQAKVTALITACPVLDPENGNRMFHRNVCGLIEENTAFFILTAVRN